jgi:large repetitive protein
LSSSNTPVQGDNIQITWSLNDDDTGVSVTRAAASTALVAIGPIPSDAGCSSLTKPPEFLGYSGTYPYPVTTLSTSGSGITPGPQFAFAWSTTNFNAGCYFFELDLDSHQFEQSTALELLIYVSDSSPHLTTTTLPNGVVGSAYSNTLFEAGGVSPFTWSYTGSLPSGITLGASTGTVSGTTCVAGNYSFTAKVTDKNSNYGTQALMLQIQQANTTTGVVSNANPSVFQQMVTFTVTVAPQYSCTPTGTVTLLDGVSAIASNLPLTGGIATFTTSALSVGVHSITASYSGDANFNSSNSVVWSQTVNKASTMISINSVSPSPVFVGQPITVSYTFSVVAPGAGSPTPPSGNITVLASDKSSCVAVVGTGMCTLSPAPTTAGNVTFAVAYSGDANFIASGANGNYTVYQLVFTAQPSNTGVGLTITPAVVVTAEDSSNNTLTTFAGGITLAVGSGPGTLSGTIPQIAVNGVATFSDLSINQIANGYTLVASPTGGVPAATSNVFNIDTFYVDGNGNFGTLDLPTGIVTQIGTGTVPGNTGLDLTPAPGLQVYEYNMSNELVQITPSTGAATVVGTGTLPDPANTTTGGLTNGSYFGIDMVTGNLYSINLTTGATTLVGPTSTALVSAGCSFETSLAGSATVLYYTIGSTGGDGTGCTATAFPDTLYQINPTTGVTTLIAQVTVSGSGVNEFVGSTFVGGTLYGFTSAGQEYSIIPATGVATFLTDTTALIFGAGSSN